MTPKVHVLIAVVMSLVVLGAIVWGIAVAGTPRAARLHRFDQQRLNDLRTIYREVQLLCRDPDIRNELKRELPESLDALATLARSARIRLTDPETGIRYEYRVLDGTKYELCATFSLERDADVGVFWNHPSGRHCFAIDALDPP